MMTCLRFNQGPWSCTSAPSARSLQVLMHSMHSRMRTCSTASSCGAALEAWARANGVQGFGDPGSKIELRELGGGQRGMFSKQDIKADELVLVVPFHALITDAPRLPVAAAAQQFQPECSPGVGMASAGQEEAALPQQSQPQDHYVALAIQLLEERAKGPASKWYPYISTLPDPVPCMANIFTSEASLAQLEDVRLGRELTRLRRLLRHAYDRHRAMLVPGCTYEAFEWAMQVVWSRSYHESDMEHVLQSITSLDLSPAPGNRTHAPGWPATAAQSGRVLSLSYMAPLVDMINHAASHPRPVAGAEHTRLPSGSTNALDPVVRNCRWRVTAAPPHMAAAGSEQLQGLAVHVTASRDVAAGDELFVSYRAEDDNARFLLYHGWVPGRPGNLRMGLLDGGPHEALAWHRQRYGTWLQIILGLRPEQVSAVYSAAYDQIMSVTSGVDDTNQIQAGGHAPPCLMAAFQAVVLTAVKLYGGRSDALEPTERLDAHGHAQSAIAALCLEQLMQHDCTGTSEDLPLPAPAGSASGREKNRGAWARMHQQAPVMQLARRTPLLHDLKYLARQSVQADGSSAQADTGWGQLYEHYLGRIQSAVDACASTPSAASALEQLAGMRSSSINDEPAGVNLAAYGLALQYRAASKMVHWDFLLGCSPHALMDAVVITSAQQIRD